MVRASEQVMVERALTFDQAANEALRIGLNEEEAQESPQPPQCAGIARFGA